MGKRGVSGKGKKERRRESCASRPVKKEFLHAKNINATVMILRGFLNAEEIACLQQLGPKGRLQNHDRSEELDFEHTVYRFEEELVAGNKALHDRLLEAMFLADDELWWGIPAEGTIARGKLHAEIEFISYDADLCAKRNASPPYIGPHVDNAAAVTLIGQLAQFRDDEKSGGSGYNQNGGERGYTGGFNLFEIGGEGFGDGAEDGGIAKGLYRQLRLNKGDVLMFRGEMLEHSLTPVTQGLRQIVQIELCRAKVGRH